ncbi:hypothetical protein [Sinorhizobium meliloti]|nr:hypothetical protein [Sinorhizobium meliloti]
MPPKDNLPAVDIHFVVNPRRSLNPAETAFVTVMHEMMAATPFEERTYS